MEKSEVDIQQMITKVQQQSGYNLGQKLFKYKNSRVVKAFIKELSESKKIDTWSKELLKGFNDCKSKSPEAQKRLTELDVIFDKQKEKTKEHER